MPASPAYSPSPEFETLGRDFADPVAAAAFPAHIPRFRNQSAAAAIGLDTLSEAEWEAHFARFSPLPRNMQTPLAMRYHGHQFRVYNADIGDGRGFLYAQLKDGAGRLLDLATKGSGQTPYSRFGDGRLTLKGGVREVLAAEMLAALGVNTSKAFALFETGESLTRNDEPSPTRGAVLTRLSHSHIRFGTFQRLAYFERADLIRVLIDHIGAHYYPDLAETPIDARAGTLMEAVSAASAHLAAQWMAAGFVHGVLNTDNMTITGESFDYGPWRFLPRSEPGFTAAYFDESGLYAFARQPEAASWNLMQLASCLTLVSETAPLEAALGRFAAHYQAALREAMFARLGIAAGDLGADLIFLQTLFQWMSESGVGWARFFHDWFCGAASETRAAQSPAAALYANAAFADIRAGMTARDPVRPERLEAAYFARRDPCDMVIEEVESLWTPIAADDDWTTFQRKIDDVRQMGAALDLT